MEGAIRGLNISLRKPYDGNELQMWNKALKLNKDSFKGSFSMGVFTEKETKDPFTK